MSSKTYWNSAIDPYKSGRLRNLEGSGDVRAGGRTCPVLLSRIRLGNQVCLDFLESCIQRSFLMICTSPTHTMYPSC
jgi:hypothetical protein